MCQKSSSTRKYKKNLKKRCKSFRGSHEQSSALNFWTPFSAKTHDFWGKPHAYSLQSLRCSPGPKPGWLGRRMSRWCAQGSSELPCQARRICSTVSLHKQSFVEHVRSSAAVFLCLTSLSNMDHSLSSKTKRHSHSCSVEIGLPHCSSFLRSRRPMQTGTWPCLLLFQKLFGVQQLVECLFVQFCVYSFCCIHLSSQLSASKVAWVWAVSPFAAISIN